MNDYISNQLMKLAFYQMLLTHLAFSWNEDDKHETILLMQLF
jgi:hypothetical protein